MTADLILHNGRFHTVDRDNPTATAVAATASSLPSATTPRRCSIAAAPPR